MFKNDHHTNKLKRKPKNRKYLPLKLSFLGIIGLGIVTMLFVPFSPSTVDENIAINASPTPTETVPNATEDTHVNADLQRLFVRATAQTQGGIPARLQIEGKYSHFDTRMIGLRAIPRVDSPHIEQVPIGTIVTALGQSYDGAWVKIAHQDFSQAGWVFIQFVTLPEGIENLPVIDS